MIKFYNSIFTKLHLFFILATIVLISLFISALKEQEFQKNRLLSHRTAELARVVIETEKLGCLVQNKQLKEAGFKPINFIPKNYSQIELPKSFKFRLKSHNLGVEIYRYKNSFIYRLHQNGCTNLYQDTATDINFYNTLIIFIMLFGGLGSLYFIILKNLLPLRNLHSQIIKYSESKEFDYVNSSGRDEIALISNMINDGIARELRLKKSRELFMRNTMHELKTPITKGKLIVELSESSDNRDKLEKLFRDLENLVIQMAEIEKMHAFSLERSSFKISEAIESAMELLGLDESTIEIVICDEQPVFADKNLFTSALKNLIDNAHAHATTYPIIIECDNEKVCVKNAGEPLKRPIEESLQAFVTDRGRSGLGLGLYIAQSVCELHDFNLSYRYISGVHHFCIGCSNIAK